MSDDFEPSSAPDDTAEHESAEGQEHENEELVRRLVSWERRSRSHFSRWRQEARRAFAFVAGDQWEADAKAKMLEEMRQPITFNRVGPMVDAVTGAEILNRQEVKFSPREIGDAQTSELITAAHDWTRDQTDAEDEESDAFADTVICGMGWTETRMDYDNDADGVARIDRVDPFEMWTDPDARKRNLADARYHFRARWMDKDDVPEEWRDKLGAAGNDGDVGNLGTDFSSRGDDYEEGDDETDTAGQEADKRKVWIRHFQWWEHEDAYKVSDPQTGKSATWNADKFRALVTLYLQNGLQPPEAAKVKTRRYKYAFLAGNTLLETGDIDANAFTFQCITGKRDRNNGWWYGIVRAMMDPQMWANKWLSQILHILNTSAKGGVMIEEGATDNVRKLEEDWAKPDAVLEFKPGALARGAIQERTPKTYPAGLDKLMEFAVNSMPQVTGINLELLGLVQKDQPGVLEAQRKQAGYAILAVFFDSLRRYRKMQGRVMLYFIQEYMSDGRLIRISGDQGLAQYAPLVKQRDTAVYDIIVDEAPMSANQKEAVWGMMVQMMPMLLKQPIPPDFYAELLRYSPLPTSVSQKLGQALAQMGQPDPQAEALRNAGAELELRKSAATAAKDETAAQLNQARAVQAMRPPKSVERPNAAF